MARSLKDYLLIGLKGLAMGGADVVPGVSGGTIAFISGIYEELLDSISTINWKNIQLIWKEGIPTFWKAINGWFLVAIGAGIITSLLSLAKLLGYLLEHHPVQLWGFFFGLILASAVLMSKTIEKWGIGQLVSMLAGTAIAYYITVATPAETSHSSLMIFLSGMIAICAMILPGISGAFILLLLGKYRYVLDALSNLDLYVIVVFGAGAATGLLTFSRVFSWLLKKYHGLTVALLTGFMIGSLNKVWPWKNVTRTRINSHGEEVPFTDISVLPANFEGDPTVTSVVILAIVGLGLILGLEAWGKKLKQS